MRFAILVFAAAQFAGGCSVVGAGVSVAGAAVSVGAAAVSTAATVGAAAVKGVVKAGELVVDAASGPDSPPSEAPPAPPSESTPMRDAAPPDGAGY